MSMSSREGPNGSAFGHIDKVNSCITATSVSLPKCTWVIQWRLHMYAPNTWLINFGLCSLAMYNWHSCDY